MSYLTYNPATNRYPVRGFSNPNAVQSLDIGDPYENNVILFLKGDGENNSTNIIDSSLTPKTITRFGNTQISTNQSKYGGSSIFFDGNGDYLITGNSNDYAFGVNDFTVELWLFKQTQSQTNLIDFRPNTNGVFFLLYTLGNNIYYFSNAGIRITGVLPGDNQWIHIAFSRTAQVSRLYVNGIQSGSNFTDNFDFVSTNKPTIGSSNNTTQWFLTGYIDSLRITKGVARYTANFNPETDTYLNS